MLEYGQTIAKELQPAVQKTIQVRKYRDICFVKLVILTLVDLLQEPTKCPLVNILVFHALIKNLGLHRILILPDDFAAYPVSAYPAN